MTSSSSSSSSITSNWLKVGDNINAGDILIADTGVCGVVLLKANSVETTVDPLADQREWIVTPTNSVSDPSLTAKAMTKSDTTYLWKSRGVSMYDANKTYKSIHYYN